MRLHSTSTDRKAMQIAQSARAASKTSLLSRKPWFLRPLVSLILVSLFATFLPMTQILESLQLVQRAEALTTVKTPGAVSTVNPGGGLEEIRHVGSVETRYGLVTILVDEDTWDSQATGASGLFSFLGNTNIDQKIETYAEDIQATIPWTKTMIVTVSEDDTPVDIMHLLEELYFQGNPDDDDSTKLTGVVAIGDVPLPVVNKNGHRFISMLPYTDFEAPAYLLDETTQDFVPNLDSQNFQAEVWHGLIVPPVDGSAGIDLLAEFFDKNHAFHSGDEDATNFDQKTLVTDFVTEEATVNGVSFDSYNRFTDIWEEMTYYQYTNDLLEEMYVSMMSTVEEGDFLDNDGDGAYDEEAANGRDDDGDGLIDEDLGDGFYGIDNDEDGEVDEDSYEDNNNDADWVIEDFWEDDLPDFYQDRMTDEDPPGDANGDGCPGVCGVDDNGFSEDHDGDGYPTAWEVLYGYPWDNDKRPYRRVSKMVNAMDYLYDVHVETDEEATEFLQSLFIDDMYGDYYQSPTCMDSGGNFHPEWDDDEDGFCDEDGSTEMQVWLNASGYPASGTCAYNDADCDGLLDEDPVGMRPEEIFENIPDMQSKQLIESLISRYADIFEKPQGVWNRLVNQSGRYKSRYIDEDGNTVNDYDTAVSLIAKKDEATLLYLGEVNAYFEEALDEVADDLQKEIPMVAVAQITGYYIPYEADGSEGDPVEICDEDLAPDVATDACIQFVNHSTISEGKKFSQYTADHETNNVLIYGETLWEIQEPSHCTIFAGTEEEGGQKVQWNTLYSVSNVEIDDRGQIDQMNNCVPDYASFREDIPELCNEPTVEYPIRALDGARDAAEIAAEADLEDTSQWETGFEACFEFREMHTFEIYKDSYEAFNEWMYKQIRRFRKDEDSDDLETYEEFLEMVDAKKAEATPETGTATLQKNYSELDILASDAGATYSVVNMLEDFMGWTGEAAPSNDQIDTFLGVWRDADEIVIEDPDFGTGMSGIAELQITLDKLYIDESTVGTSSPKFTTQLSNAYTIPSMYKHVEPTGETLAAQVQNPGAQNLPIDKTRRVSFLDEDDTAQYWNYINLFDAETLTDVNVQLKNLAEDVAATAGGSGYRSDVVGFIDGVNEDQLEDALAWMNMNIDEKHHYVLTHYLGEDVAINAESLPGYEMVSMIADGSATEMYFGFNGAMPGDEEEGDLMWKYRSQEAIDAALAAAASTAEPEYDSLNNLDGTTPVLLSEWMEAIQEWIEDTKQAANSFKTYDGGEECGDISQFGGSADDNGDGMPDGADDTVTLKLTSDDNNVLQAGGKDYYIVTAAAYGARGFINTDDSYTEVELEIVSGDGVVEVSGNSTLKLTGGTATFALASGEVGSFTLRADPVNRSDLYSSNTLSGSVTSKFVAVTTYVKEAAGTDAEIIAGDKVEVFDDSGNLLAILDPETGDLELRIVSGERATAQILEATEDKPTRFAVSHGGAVYAVFFVISSIKEVWIGSGIDGVFVSKVADFVDAEKIGSGSSSLVYLYDFEAGDGAASGSGLASDGLMGAVGAYGQIAVSDGYYLEFENPGELNIFDPIHIYNGDGEDLFKVDIGHVFTNANLSEPVNEHADYLSQLVNKLLMAASFVKNAAVSAAVSVARAASGALDSDDDSLSDLQEWTIGTDLNNPDTDLDNYPDGEEIFAGYSPLVASGPLFTDLGPDHEAFNAVIELYLRGIVSGYADGSFLPNRNMSREEFVKVNLGSICVACTNFSDEALAELMNSYLKSPFPDTDINPELLPCVAYAKQAGIVSGYEGGDLDGYFLPGRYISRAEAVKVLVETAELDVAAAGSGETWYAPYVNTALKYNLFSDENDVTTAWLSGYITRGEFAMMAVNLLTAQDCRNEDGDDDGLSDTEEELVYGTDPNDADTDGGGVSDFDEVIRGSDPLDASDDFGGSIEDDDEDEDIAGTDEEDFSFLLGFSHAAGLYAVAEDANAGFEEISVISSEGDAIINVFTNEIAADGESVLFVKAEIRDQAGEVYVTDNTSVIEFILSTVEHGDVQNKRVQVSSGQAETTFVTTQIAGEVQIEARITDGSLPSEDAKVQVYPGDPVRLGVASESSVLPAGGEAITDVRVTLYDSFGNAANNGFYGVTLSSDGGITILDLKDEDSGTEGIQVTTPDGYIDFRILASTTAQTARVLANLINDPSNIYSSSIEHIDGMRINLTPERDYMFAGGERTGNVAIAVTDRIGRVITGFQGDVYLSMSDPGYGVFSGDNGMGQKTVSLTAGEGIAELAPGTLAGLGSIIAESTGIEAGSAPIEIKPSEAYELRLREENDSSVLSAGKNVRFYVEAYDVYGNLVNTDSSTRGEIRTTEATSEYATLSSDFFVLNQGSANFTLRTTEISGKLNLVVTSGDLLAGTWSGDINFSLTGEDFADVEPMMLYGSLLGGPFGDVTQEDYIAGWMTFNGKTQAMTSLISEPVPKKRLVAIDAEGAVSIPDESLVTQTVQGAGSELPVRLQWRSFPDDTLIGEVFYVTPTMSEAISVELLTARYGLEIDDGSSGNISADTGILLREDGAAVVKIRDDGQIVLMDPNYSLAINSDTDGLGFIVMRTTEQVMRIDFNVTFSGVNLLSSNFDLENWDSKTSGIYLRPTTASENATVSVPSGNSSLNPMGLAIVDPNEDLPQSMQPSLGYMSLESAESDGGIGWENENKHLLLFAAGNTVGQSNLFYPSEVGVVLGDPTVSVQTQTEFNALGYTKDIGTMVSAAQEEILTLMDIDYNDDGMEDVLIAYESGLVEVLQNFKAPVRLQNEGGLLYVENGISAIDRGDFNGDGMEDIFVVSQESCYADEMCMYIYENIGGGFVAQNLTLSGISGQPTQVVVADLNNDDYSDLVIADENLVLYVVWNAEGTLETVDEIEDFGLRASGSVDLAGEVVLSYDGLEDDGGGSVRLSVPSTNLDVDSIGTDLEALLAAISGNPDYDFNLNGEAGGELERLVDLEFEFADTVATAGDLTITKTLDDENGGRIEVGDTLSYTIEIDNVAGSIYNDFYLADSLAGNFEYLTGSITAEFVATDGTVEALDGDLLLEYVLAGESAFPWILGPFSMAAGEELTVTYEVTVNSLPSLTIMVDQDFHDDYKDDNYADIAVSMEGNNTGILMVYYSDGYITESEGGVLGSRFGGTTYRRVNYVEKKYVPEDYGEEASTEPDSPFDDLDGDGTPDFIQDMDPETGVPVPSAGSYDVFAEIFGATDVDGDGYYSTEEMFQSDDDVDGDGILDIIDLFVGDVDMMLDPSLDLDVPDGESVELSSVGDVTIEGEINALNEQTEAVTQVIEDIVSAFTCNGGCIAFPGSISFLTPGTWHDPFTGTTFGFDQGFPLFGITPNPPFVCSGPACFGTSVMRIYVSPTTTLGLGLGICVSVYGTPLNCMAFSIPLLQMLGVCDAINNFITDSLSTVTSFTSDGNSQAFNIDSSNSSNGEPNGLSSAIFDAYIPPVSANKNVQVPGFPSIFTEWWKAQKLELFKMLDLPDITVIYPKIERLTTGDSFEYEQESKLEAMTGSVLGLETLLNALNSLPLIDINPEPVYIHYPWLTPEEIDLAELEFEQWETDFQNEWDSFKEQFQVTHGGQLSPAEWDVYYELENAVEEVMAAIAANRAVLESYRDIPRQILEIRTLQTEYIKTIICYLDAILGHTAGYLSENVQRAEAWAQWAVDLRDIVDGWRVIIDSSVKMMDSCDKCTNQRWNSMQLIFSLFAFLPEFPVVELPKLPDIVLDISNIQAGVDITWPDLNFVPETVSIPELPRVAFPSVYLDLDADLDINLPVLPEFKINFSAPELPGLTLPDLPSIPPPPAIPEISPSIQASVSILSNILKIVCIIRNGFVPVNEMQLKAKVEDLTERSSSFVLPFDLAIQTDFPSFSFDFVERIEIRTYLNFIFDFSGFYDLFDDLGDQSNDMVGNLTEEISVTFQNVVSQIESATLSPGEIEFGLEGDVEADVDFGSEVDVDLGEASLESSGSSSSSSGLESYIHPAIETALEYKDHPLVSSNLIALQQALEQLQKDFATWDDEMPDSYELVAQEITLTENDPLLSRYDEIINGESNLDAAFIAQIQGSPLADISTLRDSLIAYVDDFESTTRKLDGMDENMFSSYLAQESAQNAANRFMLASEENEGGYSGADTWNLEETMEIFDGSSLGDANSALDAEVLLAEEGGTGTTGTGGDWDTNGAATYNDGIYLYNPEEGIAERLINYTQESDEASSILFIDIDNDGDDDIVYSMGGDVYIKENYLDNPSLRYNGSDTQISSLAEIAPENGAVYNFKRGLNSYEEASFSFSAAQAATGYEVIFYDSLDASIAEPDENVKRLLLLADEENAASTFYDSEGTEYLRGSLMVANENSAVFQGGDELSILVPSGSEFNVPGISESRLVATDVSGTVIIQNGVKRTRISENGELETSADIILQTTKDTLLKVEIDGETTNIELPPYTLIDLGSQQNRTVRVDSGEVFWIQDGETLAEQDLQVGMEIFEEEMIVLDSMLANASLQTSEGAEIELDQREVFVMDGLPNAASPNSHIALENGLFYTLVRGIFEDSSVGTVSELVTLNPQVCADRSAPYAILDSSIDLAIFATQEVSAESSFDTDSEILDAYWDLDASIDVNGDGIGNNDEEVIGMTAEIGPYENITPKEVTFWVTDAAGNQDSATMTVNIYVPDLQIASATSSSANDTASDSGSNSGAEVSGTTSPASPYFPFYLVREREGAVSELGGINYTDEYGNFLVDDLDSSDLLSVYDSNGNIVAQFNPATLQLLVFSSAYGATVLPAEDKWPTRLAVFENSNGLIIGSFLIITDENRIITQMSEPLENYDLGVQTGVTVHVLEDAIDSGDYDVNDFEIIGRDPLGNLEMTISSSGNIVIYDSSIEIVKREADSLDEYLIIEVYDNGVLEMEIWPGNPGNVQLVYTGDLSLPASGTIWHDSLSADTRLYFEDVATTDALYENIAELVERGILEGYEVNGKRYFLPANAINRAEFAKIILGILCIIPTDEAYVSPSVFSDISSPDSWFYPYTKEAFLHELITGYLGEVDSSGMAPFKPENTITRAEAAKIIIEALDKEGIIELPSAEELAGEPWYEPYLVIAQDLSPYMIAATTAGQENFILTTQEARDPAHVVTRYEFVQMSLRVLQAYNCFDLDSDGDGLINYDEESIYNTDAYNPDTDAGGVNDGTEVDRGTDPLYGADDFEDDEFDIESGIYAVRETCYSCPCQSNIDFAADLKYGDKVFGIIRNAIGEIFGISNVVTVTETSK